MKKISFILLICIFMSSCESLVDGVNLNPNASTAAPADYVLTGALANHKSLFGDRVLVITNIWTGYMTGVQRQYLSYQNYSIAASEATGLRLIYNRIFIQLKIAIDKYDDVNNRLGTGVAKVVQAHALGVATALYGDIPFSQAGNHLEFPHPVFDPQRDVYDGIQALLDEGISDLESGVGSLPDKTDIFFNGDAARWIEVAHTLKARFYMETKQYELAYDEAAKGISTPSNSLLGPSTTTAGMRNGLYTHNVTDRSGDVNSEGSYLTTLLDPSHPNYRGNTKTNEDARFHFYFLVNGGITGDIEPNTLSLGRGDLFTGIIGMETSEQMVTFQENLLILAEAAARTKSFEAALTHLNQFRSFMNSGGYIHPTYATTHILLYAPYDAADFEHGGVENPDGIDNTQALLREILEERYVTFFCQFIGFNDVRRTRKESVGIQLTPSIGDKLPERMLYDEAEITANPNAPDPLPGIFEVTAMNN